MNAVMTLADQTLNDLALFAAMIAFAAVLVVATLWTAATFRVDRLLKLASREVGPAPKAVVAGVLTAGTLAILLGYVPSHLLLDTWAATAASLWIVVTLVAVSASVTSRARSVVAAASSDDAQDSPIAKVA